MSLPLTAPAVARASEPPTVPVRHPQPLSFARPRTGAAAMPAATAGAVIAPASVADDRDRALIQKTLLASLHRAKETIERVTIEGVSGWRVI